ncbi:potassium channel family protein [Spongisporangium articulatum]|uniref:Potassium channel family protein n=1 Tax=Spongisporangium articulatum TaxID=3362603 RepID=A0ABW8AJ18_9ACTN
MSLQQSRDAVRAGRAARFQARFEARYAPTRNSAPIFLVLRRMRTPMIALIVIFSVTTLGLTLIPGVDSAGRPSRLGFFDAFYVMSYTGTTIGFGELPHPFSYPQRMWVTGSIYLTVIGWAYAIGSLLSLLQDRAFRRALQMQQFRRRVARLREPFLLIAGYGYAGEMLGRRWDDLGRSFVAIDLLEERVDSLDIEPYAADVPGLVADAADPSHLEVAGLRNPFCEAVLALTNDDEANLAITMSAALLRPDLPVIARTVSPSAADRMSAFGTPVVINPFDTFGDHLRLALRAPSAYQLFSWVESGPGADLPERRLPPRDGRWIVCGYGRFGRELVTDLRRAGVPLTVVDAKPELADDPALTGVDLVTGEAAEPGALTAAHLEEAVGFVAGTDSDTTNLSLVAAARRHNADLFTAARQNQAANAALFEALEPDLVLVPSESVALEAYARLSTPLLWRFLQATAGASDDEAREILDRLTGRCGYQLPDLWKVRLSAAEAPALGDWLASGTLTIGGMLRDPDERDRRLPCVPLLLSREGSQVIGPGDDVRLAPGDEVLFAGGSAARRELTTTLTSPSAATYVATGERVAEAWLWRRLSRRVG